MKKLLSGFALVASLTLSAQTPCDKGMAGDYPCNQINLLSHLSPTDLQAIQHGGFYANDLWGWTDPETQSEYVILGLKDGVVFIDVTTPTAPVIIGKLPEPPTAASRASRVMHGEKSTWRDIKVANNYAYIVSDLNADHGMQVVDLTRLKDETPSIDNELSADGWYRGLGSSHNVVVNEQTNFVIAVGLRNTANTCSGGLHIINVEDPINPQFETCFSDDGYTHDAQYVTYTGPHAAYEGHEIVFASNENSLTIVDITDKSNIVMLGRETYDQVRYSHQGWLSEDQRFFIQNDELDEREYGHTARTLIWNIEDLTSPTLIGSYYHNEVAIDHNLYTHENLVYAANYKSGLRVLDMSAIADGKLREVAHFDTYPELDDISFGGAWSSYPYFKSGTIAVSDMDHGLFLLELDLTEDPISSHPKDTLICDGGTAVFSVATTSTDWTYQWQKYNGKRYTDIRDDATTSGAQTPEISFPANRFNEGTVFRCMVMNETHEFYSFGGSYTLSGSLPKAGFNFETGDHGDVSFINASTGASAYLWQFGDGNTSEEASPNHTYSNGGEYEVTLIAMNDFGGDTLRQRTAIITATTQPQEWLIVHPNPATSLVTLTTQTAGRIQVINMSGQCVWKSEIQAGVTEIPITHLENGQYILMLENEKQRIQRKLLKR